METRYRTRVINDLVICANVKRVGEETVGDTYRPSWDGLVPDVPLRVG